MPVASKDVIDFGFRERFLLVTGPNCSGPGDIVPSAADDVNVELADNVADGGDVHFVDREGFFDPPRKASSS